MAHNNHSRCHSPFSMLDNKVHDRTAAVLPRVEVQLHTAGLNPQEPLSLGLGGRLALGPRGENRGLLAGTDSAGGRVSGRLDGMLRSVDNCAWYAEMRI